MVEWIFLKFNIKFLYPNNRIPLEVNFFSIIHLTIDKIYQCNGCLLGIPRRLLTFPNDKKLAS